MDRENLTWWPGDAVQNSLSEPKTAIGLSCLEGTLRWVSAGGTPKAYITFKKTSITTSCGLSSLAPGAAFSHSVSVLPCSWAKFLTFERWNPGGTSSGDLSRFFALNSMPLLLRWRIASHAKWKTGLVTSSSWSCRRNSQSFGPAGLFLLQWPRHILNIYFKWVAS